MDDYFHIAPLPIYTARAEGRRLRRTISALCLTVVLGILLFTFLGVFSYLPMSVTVYQGYCALIYLLAFGVPTLLYVYHTRTSLRICEGPHMATTRMAAALVLIATACCLLANYPASLVSWVLEALGFSQSSSAPELENTASCMIFYMLSVAVIPPLVEEVLFRGLILQKLRAHGTAFALVVSSALFAIFHGDLSQAVFAFFCGLALGAVMIKTGRIWLCMLVHFFNNALSAMTDILSFYGSDELAWKVYAVLTAAIFILAFGVAAVWLNRRFHILRQARLFAAAKERSPVRRWAALAASPGFWVLLVLSATEMVLGLLDLY